MSASRTAGALTLLCLVSTGTGRASEAPEFPQTRALVELVTDAGQMLAQRGVEAACIELSRPGSRWLDGDLYVFVLDGEGTALCHPAQPSLEGRSLIELRDPKGKPIVASFLRELSASDEAWVHYQWPRPGNGIFTWKSTYVRRVTGPDGTELVVGAGAYDLPMEPFFVVDQVDDAVALLERDGEAALPVLRDPATGFVFQNAYVFVLDRDGVLLVNHAFPQNEGRDLRDLQDIDGRYFVREMLRVPVGSATWIDYKWPRPGDTRPSAKRSYVRAIDWQGGKLIVGAGVYFEPEPAIRDLGPASDAPIVDDDGGRRP
ncbi:MAG: cache domain-containing protein [Thermoanaerobaculia bacterium]